MSSVVKSIGAYAKLLRLSNGPTAVADVWMGYAVVSGVLEPTWPLALMTVTSLLLYHGGMIANDVVDVFDDRAEGRDRPLATGQLHVIDAGRLFWWMTIGAFLTATAASVVTGLWPGMLAFLLWNAIRWYNSPLKKTLAGPPLMGLCRGLNVALGASVAGFGPESLMIPLGVACYVDGLTLFARDERVQKGRWQRIAGVLVSLLGITWLALWPELFPGFVGKPRATIWPLFWAVTALLATRGMVAGILHPTPRNIGRGVGVAIQGLVIIDATLAALYAGPVAGLAILALLPVTMLLARWIPQT